MGGGGRGGDVGGGGRFVPCEQLYTSRTPQGAKNDIQKDIWIAKAQRPRKVLVKVC